MENADKILPKEKRAGSIRNRLLLFLLIVLLPVLMMEGVVFYHRYETRLIQEFQSNLEIARAFGKTFENFYQNLIRAELIIGLALTDDPLHTLQDQNRILDAFQADYPSIRSFFWINEQGIIVASSLRSYIGLNISDRSFYREVIAGRDWHVSELIVGKASGKPAFTISRGIRNQKGELLGIVAASIEPDSLDTALSLYRSSDAGVSLIDHKGMNVYRYPNLDYTWEQRNWLKNYPVMEDSLSGREVTSRVVSDYSGKKRLVAFVPISGIGWVASASRSENEVVNDILSTLLFQSGLILIIALAGFGSAVLFSRPLTKSITRLRDHAVALGRGEKTTIEEPEGPVEIRELYGAFQTMDGEIQRREVELRSEISKHKQTELELRQSEERYRGVVQNTTAIILRIDPQGIIRFANERALQFFGYSAEELIGKHAIGTIVQERESTGRDLAAMVNGIAENPDLYHSNANENIRKNGERVWIEWTNSGIYDTDGKLKEFLSVGIDATGRKQAEERIRAAHRQTQSIIDNTPEIVYAFDLQERFIIANTALAELLNSTPEQLIGKRRHEFMPREDADWHEANDRQVIEAGRSLEFEEYSQLKGRSITWLTTKFPLRDEQGKIYAVAGISADITDRKWMEETLRKAKDELEERVRERTYELYVESLYSRSLIEASLDPLVTISPEGKITDVNHATEEATGLLREQLIGSDFSDYFTEPQKARAGYEEVFREGFVRDYPLELKHRDGQVTPVLYNASVYRDDAGRIMGVLAAARDITKRRLAEEALKAERQRLYDVLETLPAMICLLTPDYHVAFANKSFRDRFGESEGRHCYEYCYGKAEPCEFCESYRVLETGQPHHWEVRPPDGSVIAAYDFPFTDTDGSPLILEMDLDITDRRQAEAALRRLASELVIAEERERKRVAGIMHDEIAQTLAAVKMRLDVLKGTPYDGEPSLRDAKELLAQSIRETRALMNDLGNPLLADMGLKAACEALAERLMESYPIWIICDIRDMFKNVDPDVKTILYQVIRELLTNTVKHSKAKTADVSVSLENGFFKVGVTDDGVGFDPQTLGTPSVEGGFGLFSIRERLAAISGSLEIESVKGGGTIVTARIPATLDSPPSGKAQGKTA